MSEQAANDSTAPPDREQLRLVRLDEVMRRVGLGKSAIYSRIRAKLFPIPVQLGGGRVARVEAEVAAWIAARIDARNQAA